MRSLPVLLALVPGATTGAAPAPPLPAVAALAPAGGANWTGDMHPAQGMPPGCNLSYFNTFDNGCAPSWADLLAADQLWPCPAGANTTGTCSAGEVCVPPNDPTQPICQVGLSDETPCCCPAAGCTVTPQFNWIVGVCRGAGCACSNFTSRSCEPDGKPGTCADGCSGESVPCCFGNDVTPLQPYYAEGTHAVINYVAAYQFDAAAGAWALVPDSSFNTDGRYPAFDMMQPNGGLPPALAWLAPQPGGSVFWSVGYYPAGVAGVGPPGAMFVLSTEDWFGGTFYMLNQVTLDRGPAFGYPASACDGGINDNCWASGNAGEMDFLEPAWNQPGAAGANYTQAFATSANQVGRCFTGGVNTGGFRSDNWVATEASPLAGSPPEPVIYVAVVDAVGTWVYRIPAERAGEIWPGLGRTTAAAVVPAAPAVPPESMNPGNTSYGASFTSNCQARNVTAARAQNCVFSGVQGFCGNWFSLMADTHQPLFPSENCTRDVRGGETMPWCTCMVGRGGC
jgi:hypothetical protein